MSQIFISYARDDDEPFVKQLYQDLTENGIDVWWDRKAMESRGRTFLQELRDAIEASDRLIAIIGPTAVTSDYVKAEWEHALLFAKGIVPILRCDDYDLVPSDLSKLHCPDFRKEQPYHEALEELLDILAKPVPELGPFLTAVPSLPPHFLHRFDEIARLGETVLADVKRPTVITSAKQTTALQGMGGVGKSVMAAAFARATETRRAFADGVIWLTIGQNPDPSSNLLLVGTAFGDDPVNYVDLDTARARLPEILSDKVCLIVLDDVWNVAHATPFVNALGPRCRLLIATRDGSLVTALGAQEHSLDVLTDAAALQLLENWCDQDVGSLPSEAVSVANECGNLPLALSLCGAMARDGTPWSDMRDALQEADLTFIEGKIPNYPYPDVLKALKVSVDALAKENPAAAEHYHKLAVFPADEEVPEAAVLTFWLHTYGLKERDARRLLTTLERKALLWLEGEAPHRLVSLHDLQYDYLRAVVGDLSSLHKRLLDAYQDRCADGWKSGPNDGYFFEHLAYHMVGAGRKDELQRLFFDFEWLQTKLEAIDVNSIIRDYDYLPDDHNASFVQNAIQMSAHVLSKDKTLFRSQLYGRLMARQEPEIRILLNEIRYYKDKNWLYPLTPSLMQAGGPLIRTLQGHNDIVNAVALMPDGKKAISASNDDTLKVWNIETGNVLRTLWGHNHEVNAVALMLDGKKAISASTDQSLKVWDIETGEVLRTLWGHNHGVNAVALMPDGKKAISASSDKTLKVWDIKTGEVLRTLEGHTGRVMAVSVTPDGHRVISGSFDDTLKVWDIETGEVLRTLEGHTSVVNEVVLVPDGKRAISASYDTTLKVWDIETGEVLRTLEGHTDRVYSVALMPDGKRAISASYDTTLKVWDIETGEVLRTLEGHSGAVSAIALTPDGKRAISASHDKTLKVWDIDTEEVLRTPEEHTNQVNAIALIPDGKRAISASRDKTLKVWDIETGEVLQTLKGHNGWVKSVVLMPDGKRAISASDKTLKVWDIETGEVLRARTFKKDATWFIHSVAPMLDGKRAILASSDALEVWDIETGKVMRTLDNTGGYSAVLMPDGKRAISASYGGILKVWDIETGEVLRKLQGNTSEISRIALMPDGKRAISAGDKTLKVWDIETRKVLRTLEGHTSLVSEVVLVPDGKRAISVSQDQTVKVWDIETGEMMASFCGDSPLHSCAVSLDGTIFIAGEVSGHVHFLRLKGVE